MKKVLNNIGLKTLSIFLSVLLWFYVQGREISEMAVKYGLIYNNLSENLYIDNTSTNEILVWIKGPKNLLRGYSKNDAKIDINLKNFGEGRHNIEIKEDMLKLSGGLEVIKIQPNKLTITIAKFLEKRVKVIPDYKGERRVMVEPSIVKIKGDRKTIFTTDVVYTEEFDVKGRKTFYVKLVPPSENIKLETEKVKIIVY
ncbi:MAG: CdaR family protein [Proteobacteria bacterium]|nr:CdaR family protein [Pseudomonadota bacterium]